MSRRQVSKTIDAWLVRLGYLSQIGLLALGAFGLFYTVIPLYQKAVIDEQIAQKTLQLQRTTESLKKTYGELRDYIAWSALFGSFPGCMGMMVPPSFSHHSLTDRQPPWHHVLDIPVQKCLLTGVIRYSRLGLLMPPDREYFIQGETSRHRY